MVEVPQVMAGDGGVRVAFPNGVAFGGGEATSFTIATPEVLGLLPLFGERLQYRAGIWAAPRFDSNPLHVGNEWFLDAGLRPIDLKWEFTDLPLGIGPTLACDVGIRTDFEQVKAVIRAEIGLSLDELLFFGVRYSFTTGSDVQGIESLIGLDVIRLIQLMHPIDETDEFR